MFDRAKIIARIQRDLSPRFRVLDNTGADKKIVAGQFPDILVMQSEPPPNNNILFVLKIETGANLVDSVSEWKALASASSVLYVVVPNERLDEAKKLADATGVKARFAGYSWEGDDVQQVHYE